MPPNCSASKTAAPQRSCSAGLSLARISEPRPDAMEHMRHIEGESPASEGEAKDDQQRDLAGGHHVAEKYCFAHGMSWLFTTARSALMALIDFGGRTHEAQPRSETAIG